jgi:uncharacterized protein
LILCPAFLFLFPTLVPKKRMSMMDHIVDHSVMVSNVTMFLCHKFKKTNPDLNEDLSIFTALLHDIIKTRSFTTSEIHSETGGELLEELRYPEVANTIKQHVILNIYENYPPDSEHEIINYSDKRVLHDRKRTIKSHLFNSPAIELIYLHHKET